MAARSESTGTSWPEEGRSLEPCRKPDRARTDLLIRENRSWRHVGLRELLHDLAVVPHAAARAGAALERNPVFRPRVDVEIDAVPIRADIAIIAGECVVVVGRAQRRARVARVERDGIAAAVRQIRIGWSGHRRNVEILWSDRPVVGE